MTAPPSTNSPDRANADRSRPRRHGTLAVALMSLGAAIAVTLAQPADSGSVRPAAEPTEIDRPASLTAQPLASIEDRLRELSGDDPLAHFRLAEDLAFNVGTTEAVRLARQLFVVAWEIDRELPADRSLGIGRSVCLALADLAAPEQRRYLLALADAATDDRDVVAPWVAPSLSQGLGKDWLAADPRDSLRLAQAIARFRAGDGVALRRLLDELDVVALLTNAALDRQAAQRLARVLSVLEENPRCPRCRNDRVVPANRGPDQAGPRYVLCPTCGGHTGPKLTNAQLAELLRAQALLLRVDAETWTGQRLIDGATPIRTLDPAGLAEAVHLPPGARRYVFPQGEPLQGAWR